MTASFYPNPVQDQGVLQIFTDAETKTNIELTDQEGRSLGSIYTGNLYSGGSTFDIDTKALSSGLYLIVLRSGEGTKTIKFLKYE